MIVILFLFAALTFLTRILAVPASPFVESHPVFVIPPSPQSTFLPSNAPFPKRHNRFLRAAGSLRVTRSSPSSRAVFFLLLLLLAGDVETNPGPISGVGAGGGEIRLDRADIARLRANARRPGENDRRMLWREIGEYVLMVAGYKDKFTNLGDSVLEYKQALLGLVNNMLIYLHLWGEGETDQLAACIGDALGRLRWPQFFDEHEKAAVEKLSEDVMKFIDDVDRLEGRLCIYKCTSPTSLYILNKKKEYYEDLNRVHSLNSSYVNRIATLELAMDRLEHENKVLKDKLARIQTTPPPPPPLPARTSRKRSRLDREEIEVLAKHRRIQLQAIKRKDKNVQSVQTPPPVTSPITSPAEWRERVKQVTHCKSFNERCRVVCEACNHDYKGRSILLSSHLAHLKNKHGGFTPDQVDSRHQFLEFIPQLLTVGEQEIDRRRHDRQQQDRNDNNDARQDRLDRYCRNRHRSLRRRVRFDVP